MEASRARVAGTENFGCATASLPPKTLIYGALFEEVFAGKAPACVFQFEENRVGFVENGWGLSVDAGFYEKANFSEKGELYSFCSGIER